MDQHGFATGRNVYFILL